ncbi:MAG: glycosyltransferase family 39 protein [Planctomycetota bacterium]
MPVRRLLAHPAAAPIAAAALICLMLLPRLGDAPLGKTEGHRALTAHGMVESGNWVTPRLFEQLYLRKPPGQYWLVAMSESVLGPSEFAWRLPSALATAGIAAFVAWTARRWFGTPAAGWAAGLSVACLIPLWDQGLTADLDAAHNLAVVIAAVAFIELVADPRRRKRRWAWTLTAAVATSAVLLIKVHAGLPLIAGAILGSAVATSRWRAFRQPYVYAALLGALALPALWIALLLADLGGWPSDTRGLREAGVPFDAIGIVTAFGGGLLAALLCFAYGLPTTAALPLTIRNARGAWRTLPVLGPLLVGLSSVVPRKRATYRSAALAVYIAWLIYALFGITNPRYLYPTLTLAPLALAGLADAWHRGLVPAPAQAVLRAIGTLTTLGLGVALVIAAYYLWADRTGLPVLSSIGLALLAVGIAAAAGVWWYRRRAAAAAAATALLFAACSVPVIQWQAVERHWAWSHASAGTIRSIVPPDETVYVHDIVWDVPHLLWYADRPIVAADRPLIGRKRIPDGATWLILSPREARRLLTPDNASLDARTILDTQNHPSPILVRYDPDT